MRVGIADWQTSEKSRAQHASRKALQTLVAIRLAEVFREHDVAGEIVLLGVENSLAIG